MLNWEDKTTDIQKNSQVQKIKWMNRMRTLPKFQGTPTLGNIFKEYFLNYNPYGIYP